MNPVRNALRLTSLYVIAAAATAHALSAHAGKHVYPIDNAAYRQECASCHVAYPPQLLPAQSWRAVMGGLDKHFGTDASLEPAVRADILAYLERTSSGRDFWSLGQPVLRVTQAPWFEKEHRKEIAAGTAQRADVKSIANCGACHKGAENGDYGKAGRQVPGGRAR
ncbi:MAG TPA: diheme cytochrome c [Usitatibacteraceae bacterium]|nr:diheme cytochrome c [Usitatibacteraceae bacterium]